MIHGKVTCPKCSTHFEIGLTAAPAQQAAKATVDGDLGELLEAADGQPMTDWEATFYADLKARYAQYQNRTKVSDKQMGILRKIANGEGGQRREDF